MSLQCQCSNPMYPCLPLRSLLAPIAVLSHPLIGSQHQYQHEFQASVDQSESTITLVLFLSHLP